MPQPGHFRVAYGGKSLYGATVGILMLETRFPRIPGDMGNALTWPFPVLYKVVPGASPRRVVFDQAEGLLDAFLAAAAELVRLGADGITTTCGFLSLYQHEIAAHVGVPVAASSLMQIPLIERVLPPGRRVGILTISAASLTREHLAAAGADPDTPVVGTEGGSEFTRAILNDEERLDAAAAERDILDAGEALVADHPETGAVLLECTNMVPYARALSERLQKLVGLKMTFHVSGENKVTRVDGMKDLTDRMSGSSVRGVAGNVLNRFFNQQFFRDIIEMGLLPRDPIKIKDTWTVSRQVSGGVWGGNAQLDLTYVFRGWQRREATNCIRLEFSGTLKPPGRDRKSVV